MDKIKAVFCIFFGHSLIRKTFFGYVYCARCGAQVGDILMGACMYNGSNDVIVGHNCPTCIENYKKLKWRDKILCPSKRKIFKEVLR